MNSDPYEFLRKQQEQMRKLTESPVLEAMRKQQEQMRKLTESPGFTQLQQQQQQFAEFITTQPLEPLVQFRQDLADRVTAYASEESPANGLSAEIPNPAERAAFFRFRSLQFLIWQMEGLLKTVELMTAGGFATNHFAGEPVFSPSLLMLMVMVGLVGELIVWFNDQPPSTAP